MRFLLVLTVAVAMLMACTSGDGNDTERLAEEQSYIQEAGIIRGRVLNGANEVEQLVKEFGRPSEASNTAFDNAYRRVNVNALVFRNLDPPPSLERLHGEASTHMVEISQEVTLAGSARLRGDRERAIRAAERMRTAVEAFDLVWLAIKPQ